MTNTYEPTVLANVTPGMRVSREEVFVPAAAIIRVRSAEAATEIANQSPYGLGSNLWTRNIERAQALAPGIEAGQDVRAKVSLEEKKGAARPGTSGSGKGRL